MTAPLRKPASAMTILIADDHWVVRESLKQVARGIDAGVDILEFYPGRMCRDTSELAPLLDAIIELKQGLN